MKKKILNWIFRKNEDYFSNKVIPKPLDLEKIFKDHQHFFELLVVKDFIGYIPKDVNEPALKIFKEYGEQMEKWTLWQSWYVNRKAMNDPLKITFYNGMMVYLKVLNTMDRVNKKNYIPNVSVREPVVEVPWLDQALSGLNEFKNEYKTNKGAKDEADKPEESIDTKVK